MTDQTTRSFASRIPGFIKVIFQFSLYLPIQIIFIPFAVVGLIDGLYREFVKTKKLGISFSAGQALQYRWIMHYFNTRTDPISIEFIKHFPCESHFGLWSILGPLIISQRLFGFTTRLGKVPEPGEENLYSCAGVRVLEFDRIMEQYVDEMEQIVIPGAGFDLMALRLSKEDNVEVFELDQVETMNVKVETLRNAGIDHDWINYIPVDYSKESWTNKLSTAGFDKTKRTLFLWQSVSLYLDDDIVKETLREMTDLCGEGSIIAQDFYSKAFLSGEISKIAQKNMNMIEKMGEPWKFAIDMSKNPEEEVKSFLNAFGLKIREYIQFGEKIDIEPFYCIVVAEMPKHG